MPLHRAATRQPHGNRPAIAGMGGAPPWRALPTRGRFLPERPAEQPAQTPFQLDRSERRCGFAAHTDVWRATSDPFSSTSSAHEGASGKFAPPPHATTTSSTPPSCRAPLLLPSSALPRPTASRQGRAALVRPGMPRLPPVPPRAAPGKGGDDRLAACKFRHYRARGACEHVTRTDPFSVTRSRGLTPWGVQRRSAGYAPPPASTATGRCRAGVGARQRPASSVVIAPEGA